MFLKKISLPESSRWLIYLVTGLVLAALSIFFLVMSIGYMLNALVATSLLTALIGFTLFSGSLYILKLSAYVYCMSRGKYSHEEERR